MEIYIYIESVVKYTFVFSLYQEGPALKSFSFLMGEHYVMYILLFRNRNDKQKYANTNKTISRKAAADKK